MADLNGKYNNNANNGEREPVMNFNSLDYTVVVDRLPIIRSTTLGIFHYGLDNNYPRKIIQLSERSSSLVTAKQKQAQFIQGLGFSGANAKDVVNGKAVVINQSGETLYDLLKFCATEKTNINIAIHVNYNQLGEAVEFNMIQYDFVRRKVPIKEEKYDRYVIADIWHLEGQYINQYYSRIQEFNNWVEDKRNGLSFTALECFAYNPDPVVVREQIELSGGIENYSGQLFYMNKSRDIYQKAIFDSIADKFQFLAEADLASLSNIQNGYSVSGVFKYPSSINDSRELAGLKQKSNNMKGAINTGRILFVPVLSQENVPQNMFEPTQMLNMDGLYEKQRLSAENGIQELYSIPNSLIGKDSEGNFATQKMQEAFEFYNSITEPLRRELEIELTTLISNSVFASQVQLPIEIEPMKYISRIETAETNEDTIIND